jgi:site-specific DNA-cytosine methylase
MDNNGEAFATVLIIDGHRVDDVRVYEDEIVPTVTSRYGTGGGNVPMVFPTLTAANNPSRSPQSTEVTAQVEIMNEAIGVVLRLTPTECERLQGFPDDWTSGQADSNRYKQMGNAVAVPVAEWIISRMVGNDE